MKYTPENTRGMSVEVFVDGIPTFACVEADTDLGYVIVYAKDADGNFIMDGDELVTKTIQGKVEVRTNAPSI